MKNVNFTVFGYQPFWFHLASLLLHIANALLVYACIRRLLNLSQKIAVEHKRTIAFFTALIFTIHPFNVESVAWMSASKVLVYSFFYLLAIYLFFNYLKQSKLKYHILTLFIFVMLIFCSCHREKQAESAIGDYVTVPAQNIKLDNNSQLSLSNFVDKIDIIPLEFTDSCILKEIRKIVIRDDNIFIIEPDYPETVYRFDIHGNFLNRIGIRGQGPKEQLELMDFSINEEKQIVYLLDNAKQMIYCYNFDGQFIERININQYAFRLEYQNNFFYLYMDQPLIGNDLYKLIIRNMKGEIENKFFPSKKYPTNLSNQIFAKIKDDLIFYQPMNDTIYSLNGVSLNHAYYFDFGSLKFTPQEIEDIYTMKAKSFQILLNKERISEIDHLFKVGNWIYFNSIYKILSFSFLYNTDSKELKVAAHLNDDLEFMFDGNQFYGQTRDALIGTYDPSYFSENIENLTQSYKTGKDISSAKWEGQVQKMKKILRGNNFEEMNPWILLYHLKQN